MTPQEITLIRASFVRLIPVADRASILFHARVFAEDPALRAMFPVDRAMQTSKLMKTLSLCVGNLERIPVLLPMMRALGLRQRRFHPKARHYETVGGALLWMFEQELGAEFTPQTRNAWAKMYWLLVEHMKAGARDGAAQTQRAVAV